MKKTLVLTLVFLMALSVSVSAAFYPMGTTTFYVADSVDFTKANEGSAYSVSGDNFTKTYLEDSADIEGLELKALAASSGDVAGLVTADGFRFPTVAEAKQNYTYYYEFTVNMANLGNSTYRVYAKSDAGKACFQVEVSKSSVLIKKAEKSYTIPEEQRDQDVTIGIVYRTPYNYYTSVYGLYVNGVEVCAPTVAETNDKTQFGALPSGFFQLYFMSCGSGDSLVLKNYKVYESKAIDALGVQYYPAETCEYLTKIHDITFTENSITSGDITLPAGSGTQYTAADKKEAISGLVLTDTVDQAAGDINVNYSYWGTNASYLHYYELTADVSKLAAEDAYRMTIKGSNNTTPRSIATLSIGKGSIALGFLGDISSDKPGYAGSADIPAALLEDDVKLGISYDPATYTISAYLNGERVITKTSEVYKADLDNTYPSGGPMQLHSMAVGQAGNSITLKSFRAGYIAKSSIPQEGAVSANVTVTEGETTTATAILSKAGADSGHYTKATLFVAVYGADGTLKSIQKATKSVWGGESNVELTASVSGYTDGCTARAF
ncbi:MAG: hypothetical protein ACI4QW_05950, partial [Clostridia bacterium]